MSDYTKLIMQRLRQRFAESGLSQQELGQRMGYGPAVARKSAWQFLNSTEDPRLSMVERAAIALGISVLELMSPPEALAAVTKRDVVREIADLYAEVSREVLDGHLTRDQALRAITAGTDIALAGQPELVRKGWNRWRIKTGHYLHLGQKSDTEYAAALLNVASNLRHAGPVVG